MLAHSSSSPKLGRDMPVACQAEHVGWLGTAACGGGGVCPYPLPTAHCSLISAAKVQKNTPFRRACNIFHLSCCAQGLKQEWNRAYPLSIKAFRFRAFQFQLFQLFFEGYRLRCCISEKKTRSYRICQNKFYRIRKNS